MISHRTLQAALFALGFALGFSVEVQVEAAERVQLRAVDLKAERAKAHSSALLEEPAGCLDQKSRCAIRVGNRRRFSFQADGRLWTLTEKTIVIRLADDRLRLLEGGLRLVGSTTTVETEQGDLEARGDVFVERVGAKLTVVNVGEESLSFKGRGWAESSDIPSGLEAHFEIPNVSTGKTAVNLPLPLDYDNQVVREAKIFEGSKDQFAIRLERIVALRAEAAVDAAGLHQQVVERKIASLNAKADAARSGELAREARDREIRALFRRRVLNPE